MGRCSLLNTFESEDSPIQTFLAWPKFSTSASLLDSKRLNKQRVECKQIYAACTGIREFADGTTLPAIGWRNHPAVKMWKGYEHWLCIYALFVCASCDRRGIADHANLKGFFLERMRRHPDILPHWWVDEDLRSAIVRSHQSNLIRKDAEFYAPKFHDTPDNLPYVWPV